MHIVHVTHRAWPVVGGSERYVQEIARRQVLDGHRVTILATEAAALSALWDRRGRRVDPALPTEHQGVRIARLPVRHLPLGGVTFPALRRLTWLLSHLSERAALSLAKFSPWLPALPQALAWAAADLLFAWNLTLEGLTVATADYARRRGVPWIAVPLLHLGQPRFYTMRHQLGLLRQAAKIIAQTESERAFLLRRGFPQEQVHIVSPGIDPAEASHADGRRFRQRHGLSGPLLVTLGALSYNKGTVHLLSATRTLWAEGRHLTLVLVGSMENTVRRLIAQLPARMQERCLYLGRISEQEKWDAIDAADIVALPSRTESFGIVFLEAWMCGKPVIGARAGAVETVIEDGVDGVLVDFGDVAGLADALRALLDDPALAAEMGRRGRAKVLERYTWARQYDRLRELTNQVMRIEGRTDEHIQCAQHDG